METHRNAEYEEDVETLIDNARPTLEEAFQDLEKTPAPVQFSQSLPHKTQELEERKKLVIKAGANTRPHQLPLQSDPSLQPDNYPQAKKHDPTDGVTVLQRINLPHGL